MFQITVLISGSGTNLQAIIDACQEKRLPAQINLVISNKKDAYGLVRAEKAGVETLCVPFLRKAESRSEYEQKLVQAILSSRPDLIVLAGWMHILGAPILATLQTAGIQIINLHPALPGQFPGSHAIEDAYQAFQTDPARNVTGLMVHHVIPELDAGAVIQQRSVPIFPDDSLEQLRTRIQYHEKSCLIQAIEHLLLTSKSGVGTAPTKNISKNIPACYCGKVRDVYDLGDEWGLLSLVHSDRFSSFDRHICIVPGKGKLLTQMSDWWFRQTEHIIPNHLVWSHENLMIVRKCRVFPVEVVVRGYITGSTSTSLWTHYARGERVYCGIEFPDGLQKHQRLPEVVVTPTTKAAVDEPISEQEIIDRGLMTQDQWTYVKQKALELFDFGSRTALDRGYLLADTKFEFGLSDDSKILLIDEVLTCDACRYWRADSYQDRLMIGEEPVRLDKDLIREYVKEHGDPYQDVIPEIPSELIDRVVSSYQQFYQSLIGKKEI